MITVTVEAFSQYFRLQGQTAHPRVLSATPPFDYFYPGMSTVPRIVKAYLLPESWQPPLLPLEQRPNPFYDATSILSQ